tara:strand:- start:2157 stop:3038 length:882 start_codon:yes stop_codon:yes gene_type:complete
MDTCSYFIENKCLFGCYPTYEGLKELVNEGVILFIDLTTEQERIRLNVYETDKEYISFPIKDRYIPTNLNLFTRFIVILCNKIKKLNNNDKIYIHCKGGHGRSGIVVASILAYMNNISGEEAIIKTSEFHAKRKRMRDRWRDIGSPQTNKQKEFIIRMFRPIYVTNVNIHNTYYYLNNNALFEIIYKNERYKNINRCYYILKNPKLKEDIMSCNSLYEFKKIIDKNVIDEFNGDKINFFNKMFNIKFKYNKVSETLLRTFLRPIIYIEDNIELGNIWMKIRNNYHLNIINSVK